MLEVFHQVQFEATLEARSFVVIHSRTEQAKILEILASNDAYTYRDCG